MNANITPQAPADPAAVRVPHVVDSCSAAGGQVLAHCHNVAGAVQWSGNVPAYVGTALCAVILVVWIAWRATEVAE